MRWPHYLLLFALLGGVVALAFETRRLAEVAGEFERRALLSERQVEATQAALETARTEAEAAADEPPSAAAPAPPAAAPLDAYSRLQPKLHTAEEQLKRLRGVLAERDAEQARRVAAAKARADEALRPMPKGVRDCLSALHACLRGEGFSAQRFLRATAVDAEGLHDVEMLESSEDGLAVTFFTARRMTATLDRANGRLELRFFEGVRSADGERAALPDDGFAIAFHDVDGRAFEERLPYLVRAQGAYPVSQTEPERRPGLLDPGSRRSWAARLSKLLERSGTELRWSATRLRGQLDGRFLEVELVGTNDKGLVLASAHCDRVAVEIDERRDVVSLLLVDGVLRIDDVESTIDERGFRMLLPGLTPKDVTDAMMGLVIKR